MVGDFVERYAESFDKGKRTIVRGGETSTVLEYTIKRVSLDIDVGRLNCFSKEEIKDRLYDLLIGKVKGELE